MKHFSVALMFFISSTASQAAPPSAFPEFLQEDASVSLVVATSIPGDSLPAPKECEDIKVLCMRSPIWFNVTVLRQVYGTPPARQFVVSTYTHYAQPDPDDASSPRLMMLLTHGGETIMPVYASSDLSRRKDGEYFLITHYSRSIFWLPCDVDYLQEPINARDFPAGIDVPRDDYDVKLYPELYLRNRHAALPRFGISISKLQHHLERRKRSAKDFSCKDQDES